jgi:DNA-directed RNA polymerase sigma subunit (sigma70/sigma32)
MTTTKKKIAHVPHQKSFGFREQMKIGARIADALPKTMGLKECADALGLSDTMVRRIECQALFKIQKRMKEMMLNER